MPVRQLPETIVNRIAAGEVVERPASVVKELIENAIDAGATRIEIQADGGGLARILVADDDYDLMHIATLGFRGEALPSIGAVARLSIASRARGEGEAHAIVVHGGAVGAVSPSAFAEPHGARVEVRDLFYATPARLKFMKSDRAEGEAIRDVIRRLAMSRPDVAFT